MNIRTALLERYKIEQFSISVPSDYSTLEWLDSTTPKPTSEEIKSLWDAMILRNTIERQNITKASEYNFDTFSGKNSIGNQLDAIYKGFRQLEASGIITFTGYTREWMDFILKIKNKQ